MFGLKNEKQILLIHVVVLFIYKQTDRRTDRQLDISCRCIDLVHSFNYLHTSAFCTHPFLMHFLTCFHQETILSQIGGGGGGGGGGAGIGGGVGTMYMIGVGFKKLARTPVPKLPPSYPP